MADPISILVFGTAGVGKTSLCNTLCNTLIGKEEKVSNQAVEFNTRHHIHKLFDKRDREVEYHLIDTVGLNAAGNGISSEEAFDQFIELLTNSEGYSLLIHVFRIPRIAQVEQYFKLVANSPIPTVLVATGCEAIEPMSKWKTDNFHIFEKFGYKDLVCTCFAKSKRPELESIYTPLREESRSAVLEAISTYAKKPISFPPEKVSIFAEERSLSPESPTSSQLISTIFRIVELWLIQKLRQLFSDFRILQLWLIQKLRQLFSDKREKK
ncbi:hypothetical protein F7734_02025 [Scytonema sp. UIC 10036]|uniref:GTPase domain-containing protein n=1 Tax=Scytonema sp. UIC 10036 TaxID=2304196 RepID=UPI0012DACFBE|nr:GTPase domain-containing protein [Scytonema sp. UIC 10036]MUG91328.1 hypothetical protein [Scytonema sp. UIC 10036]